MQSQDDQTKWSERWKNDQTGWDQGQAHPALDQLIRHAMREGNLQPDARIFSAGCGRAHSEAALARKGFSVLATDIVPDAVQAARDLYAGTPGLTLERADVFRYDPGVTFDAVFDRAMLCALQPADRKAYIQSLRRLMRARSLFMGILFRKTSNSEGPPFAIDERSAWDLFGADFTLCHAAPVASEGPPKSVLEEWICIWKLRPGEEKNEV